MGGVNQQERLSRTEEAKYFLAGFIEGEGSFSVSIKEHPTAKFGFLVDPEFFIYQHKSGRKLLELARKIFRTGRIYPKPGSRNVLVFCIDSRRNLKERVKPFVEKYLLPFSAKKDVIRKFFEIVEALERKEHHTREGLANIVKRAYEMNPDSKGKMRKRSLQEVLERILRGHTLGTSQDGM